MCLGVVAQLDECPAKYFRIHFSDPSTVIGLICVCVCVCVWSVFVICDLDVDWPLVGILLP